MDKPGQKIGGWLLAAGLIALAVWNQNRNAKEENAKAVATSTQTASGAGEPVSSDSADSTERDVRARTKWRPVNGGYNTGPVIGQRTPVPQTLAAKGPARLQLAKATPSSATPAPLPNPRKVPFVPIGATTDLDESSLQPSKGLDLPRKK